MNNKAHLRPNDYDKNGDIIPDSVREEKEVRLIDANALKAEIIKLQKAEQNITPLAISISFENLKTLIDNAPTVIWCSETPEGLPLMDLRERSKGEWSEAFEHLGYYYHKCSNCCFGIKIADYCNFCPNCGAYMSTKEDKK